MYCVRLVFFFFKQKTAYEMRISDWSSDVCSSDLAILSLGEKIGDPVTPADFPATILRFRNDRWAEAVGLGGMTSEEWVAHFGQFQALADTLKEPLALRYHGHQFHVYNPDIGDGRGFLFAQLRDGAGRLLALGTKGSGRTPGRTSGVWGRSGSVSVDIGGRRMLKKK